MILLHQALVDPEVGGLYETLEEGVMQIFASLSLLVEELVSDLREKVDAVDIYT